MPALRGVAEQKSVEVAATACLFVVGCCWPPEAFGTLPGLPFFELAATEWTARTRGMMARLVFFPPRRVSDFFMLCFTLPLAFLFARRFSSLRDSALDQSARVTFPSSEQSTNASSFSWLHTKKKKRLSPPHPPFSRHIASFSAVVVGSAPLRSLLGCTFRTIFPRVSLISAVPTQARPRPPLNGPACG
ncbi:hypothetical protein HDK77DRAFT_233791 [Phyllosticta capitalensis]